MSNDSFDIAIPQESPKSPSKRDLKALEGSKIYTTEPTKKDTVYLSRELILCTLPHSDPGDVRAWSRKNGDLTLSIKPGVKEDPKTRQYVSIGIPYGIIPRLLLVWMVTEIIRTKSRRLELGSSFSEFLERLGLNTANGTGKRSDARRAREQMERLFRAIISFEYTQDNSKAYGVAWLDMQVAPQGVLWWSKRKTEQDSWIEVSEAFYQAVMAFPSPLDIRVLRHIKDSSLGIDLYAILNREAFRAMQSGKPRFLAWEWLHTQTGNEVCDLRNFRRHAMVQIDALQAVHSGLLIDMQKGRKGRKSGLWVSNLSNPSVSSDTPQKPASSASNRARPTLALVPPPPAPERFLKPSTVARFHAEYPNLDPYACKADFDFWADGLPPEKKPRHYDAAFMGFAKRWAVNK